MNQSRDPLCRTSSVRPPARAGIFQKTFFSLFAVPLIIAAQSHASAAQTTTDLTELSLESLMEIEIPKVYGASKLEQKTTEAPSSITIITAEEIKRYGYRTLADALASVQGFYVSYDRNYAYLGARGLNLGDFNSRILVLVDGHRMNDNLTDGAAIGTAFILDIDLIERIEVIRGPGSVLYGNNAFFGVINVITRQGGSVDIAEVSGEYGSFNTWKGRATIGKSFTNGFQFLVSGTYYDSDGDTRLFYKEFNDPARNNGVARNMDGDTFGSFFGSLSYGDFTLQGAFNRREKVNPTAYFFTTFNDPRLITIDERSYVSLKFAHSFPDIVDVTAQVYYDRKDFEIGFPVGDPTAIAFYREQQTGEWWGMELQLNKRLWEKHVITLGAEYRDDFHQSDRVFEPSSGSVFTDIKESRQNHGVYLQGDFALLHNLHLNAGARYDQYGDFDPTFNPRVALIYNPIKTATIKLIYGTAFRSPNFLELSDPRFQNIQPEEITSYELVYEQELGRHLRSSLSGFFNQMDDLIVLENGSFTNFNADAKGMELALTGSWTNGIRARMSYTFQQVEDRSGSRTLPDSPEQLVKFNLSVPLYQQKIFASLEFQYISGRHTLSTDPAGGTTLVGTDTDGFGIVNFTLFSQNLVKNLEVSASIYNLLDEHYSDPASRLHQQDKIERDGRTFRCKLTYRF